MQPPRPWEVWNPSEGSKDDQGSGEVWNPSEGSKHNDLAGPARRIARRLATGGGFSIVSSYLTKLSSQDRIPPRGAVGDVVERRRVCVGLAFPGAEFVHR